MLIHASGYIYMTSDLLFAIIFATDMPHTGKPISGEHSAR
jgi:hypothetical protein